ncbi:hypothetical protein LX32DRAFT_646881 [Colletotrichum zoysiae]|uniref:Uncharacterized protein n=1 Tax=Colletotrichum zoysiae TaxID=1216348 RepID=A0AAD9H2F0_9PEZI|nr:hypothetical protein LX32DRAFT_646881 [Colletotrichum zoysiae]
MSFLTRKVCRHATYPIPCVSWFLLSHVNARQRHCDALRSWRAIQRLGMMKKAKPSPSPKIGPQSPFLGHSGEAIWQTSQFMIESVELQSPPAVPVCGRPDRGCWIFEECISPNYPSLDFSRKDCGGRAAASSTNDRLRIS